MKYKLEKLYWSIRNFFIPQQRWLKKKIPNEWTDKCELIPVILAECVIHYVEVEKGLKDKDYDWSCDLNAGYVSLKYINSLNEFHRDIAEAYELVKFTIPTLKKQCERLLDVNNYKQAIEVETKWSDLEQKANELIVKHAQRLWT